VRKKIIYFGSELSKIRKNHNRHDHLVAVIGNIYDAALDEKLWADASPAIAATFDAPSTSLQLRHMHTGVLERLSMTKNYDAKSIAAYVSHYWQHDPWVKGALKFDLSTVLANKDFIDEADLINSEIYQDFARPLGVFHSVGALFPVGNGEFGAIGIHRPRNGQAFGEPDKALVSSFLPHLQRALQIRRQLLTPTIEHQASHEALDRTATATLVLSRDCHILLANRKAEQLFREADAIRSVGDRLVVVGRSASDRLFALVRDAANTAAGRSASSGGVLALGRFNRLPLTALVAPFRPARDGVGAKLPAAILFIRDPEGLSPAGDAVQSLFGLTPAEATVASDLADGKSVEEIAASVGVTVNTIRTHVKSILGKTGANRQSQLVGLLLRSVAIMTATA
jgi:DNA-binding CsgD family transcriptional regulator